MSTGRRPLSSAGSSPQQASRFSGLRGRASHQPSASTSRQGSDQLPSDARSAPNGNPGLGPPQQAGSTPLSQRSPSQSLSSSLLRPQGSQPPLLKPQGSPEWQSNIAYSPQSSVTSQTSNTAAGVSLSLLTQQDGTQLEQQSSTQGIRFTSTPRLGAAQSVESAAGIGPDGMAFEGSSPLPQAVLQQPQGIQQQPSGSATQGNMLQPQGSAAQPLPPIAPLAHQSSAASQQTEAASGTTAGGALRGQLQQSRLQEPRTVSDMQRQGWFQNGLYDDGQDPNLHNPRWVFRSSCMFSSFCTAVSRSKRVLTMTRNLTSDLRGYVSTCCQSIAALDLNRLALIIYREDTCMRACKQQTLGTESQHPFAKLDIFGTLRFARTACHTERHTQIYCT